MTGELRQGAGLARQDPLATLEAGAIVLEAWSCMRHDVRNKLSSVRNAAFFLRRQAEKHGFLGLDPRIASFFGLLDGEVQACDKLLERSLPPAGDGEPEPREIVPDDVVRRALEACRIPIALQVAHPLPADPLRVRCEELALGLRCLLENAAEAAPGQPAKLEVQARDGSVVFVVLDQGPGIPEADREAVLRPFHSTKPGHLGLGLKIARRLARRWGGDLALEGHGPGGRVVLSVASGTGRHG